MQNNDLIDKSLSSIGLPLHDDKKIENTEATKEKLSRSLEEFKRLRESLNNYTDKVNSNGLTDEVEKIKDAIQKSQDNESELSINIEATKKKVSSIKGLISKAENGYKASMEKIQTLVEEQNSVLDSTLLSDEEIKRYREEYNTKKIEELQKAHDFESKVDSLRKELNKLSEELDNLKIASSLGMSQTEYNEISSGLRSIEKTRIMRGIYTSLGLEEIASKPIKKRSHDEKEKIESAKEEIMKQIAEYRREHTESSVLDSIQVLYNLDVKMTKSGKVRSVSLNGEEISMVRAKADLLPAKVSTFGRQEGLSYSPAASPKDMEDVSILSREDFLSQSPNAYINSLIRETYDEQNKDNNTDEKINDVESKTIDYNVAAQKIKDRFNEVMAVKKESDYINGLIRETYDAQNKEQNVNENTSNNNSKNGDEVRGGLETMTPEEILDSIANIELDKDNNRYSEYRERISKAFFDFCKEHPDAITRIDGESDLAFSKRLADAFFEETGYDFRIDKPGEYVPNTNILKPRDRRPHESDEQYNSFLSSYYNEYFPVKSDEIEEFIENDNSKDELSQIEDKDANNELSQIEDKDANNELSQIEDKEVNNELSQIEDKQASDDLLQIEDKQASDDLLRLEDKQANNELLQIEDKQFNGNDRIDDVNLENRTVSIDQPIVGNGDNIETVKLYVNKARDEFYVRSYTVGRYELHSASNPARIGGAYCYRISRDDVDRLLSQSNNMDNVSPYRVVAETYHRRDDKSIQLDNDNITDVEELLNNETNQSEINLNDDNDTLRIGMNEDNTLRIGMNDDSDTLRIGMNDDTIPEKDTIVLYRESNSGDYYANEDTISRFALPYGDSEIIDDNNYHRIPSDSAQNLIDSANNEDSDYNVEVRNFELARTNDNDNHIEDIEDNQNNNEELNRNEIPSPVIPDDTLNEIPSLDNNPEPINDLDDNVDVERVVLFREENDNSIYVTPDILNVFGISPENAPVEYNGLPIFRISEEDHNQIREACAASTNPRYEIEYQNINLHTLDPVREDEEERNNVDNPVIPPVEPTPTLEDEPVTRNDDNQRRAPRPHVETVLQKLTEGLNIKAKDAKRFTASNIHASRKFRNELKEGNYLYFLTSIIPKTVAFVGNCFRAVGNGLLLGRRGKEVMEELRNRLDNLSEVELEVLFEEYRGHQLKTDMNNQINPLILERLRRYGMDRVTEYNNQLGNHYSQLFALSGEIDAINEQIANATGDDRDVLIDARNRLVADASGHIREIEDIRVKADNLLSGGIHGLEEDFKAVSTKLSYIGKRFARTRNFDNELQARLAEYGQGLRDGMANNDDNAIFSNFMALESEYAKNTEIRRFSLTGSKSVGSKYYTPLAERFDYRDDPFIRNLFSSVAIATSVYSAINAYKVHQIESQNALHQEQLRADAVNRHNDQVMNQVHQTGADIESRRGVFEDGMATQAYDSSLNTSGMFERGNLDANDWSFTDSYHAADHQAHIDYNQFHDEAVQGVQNTLSGYASGALNQAQALQQMADVANKAHGHLVDTVRQYQQICSDYAATHPQFDLHAFNESMDYLLQNSGSISAMNQGMVDVTDLASTLASLNDRHMVTLASLPSDMYSTLMSSFATCAYVGHILGTMNYENYNGRYGNDITAMMEEYADSHSEEETHTARR